MLEPKLGIVILNWNHWQDTLICLESITANSYKNIQLLVVDNGSSDDSVIQLRKRHPNLEILETGKNLGFTGGNNLGIRNLLEKDSDYILLLNDDTFLAPDTLELMVSAAIQNPEAGFVGPKIFCMEQPDVLLSAGGELEDGVNPMIRGIGETDRGQYNDSPWVDYLSGCALMVIRPVIQAIGVFDEDYFAYYEEIDWCLRARRAGYKAFLASDARAWHPDTRLRDQYSATLIYYTTRNSLLFSVKHNLGLPHILSLLVEYSRRLISWSLRPKWRNKADQRNALWQALTDFLRGKSGAWKDQTEY